MKQFLVVLTLAAAFQVADAQSNPWVELTKRDLAAIRTTILENHPGPVDSLNPGYRTWLEDGYARASTMADSVRSLDGAIAVLSFYTAGFQDGHLGWNPSYTRTSLVWPGIVVAKRGDRYLVHHVAPWVQSPPRIGAEIVSCDRVVWWEADAGTTRDRSDEVRQRRSIDVGVVASPAGAIAPRVERQSVAHATHELPDSRRRCRARSDHRVAFGTECELGFAIGVGGVRKWDQLI
jgi:hypothetical protein